MANNFFAKGKRGRYDLVLVCEHCGQLRIVHHGAFGAPELRIVTCFTCWHTGIDTTEAYDLTDDGPVVKVFQVAS